MQPQAPKLLGLMFLNSKFLAVVMPELHVRRRDANNKNETWCYAIKLTHFSRQLLLPTWCIIKAETKIPDSWVPPPPRSRIEAQQLPRPKNSRSCTWLHLFVNIPPTKLNVEQHMNYYLCFAGRSCRRRRCTLHLRGHSRSRTN